MKKYSSSDLAAQPSLGLAGAGRGDSGRVRITAAEFVVPLRIVRHDDKVGTGTKKKREQ